MKRGATSTAGDPLEKLRHLCLSLPETTEAGSWGHPNFRAGKKTFAAYEMCNGRPSIAIKVGAPERKALLHDRRFFDTPYGERGGWVSLWADGRLNWNLVEDLTLSAYRQVALKRMLRVLDESHGK